MLLMVAILAGCSTTKRLADGEVLYTGVKKFSINAADGEKLPDGMVTDLKSAIDVKPNNPMPFMSPYVRTPFPVGLWVYNNWSDSSGCLSPSQCSSPTSSQTSASSSWSRLWPTTDISAPRHPTASYTISGTRKRPA